MRLLFTVCGVAFGLAGAAQAQPLITFTGACDGSAAVMRDGRLLVANDENAILYIYDPAGGAPVDEFKLGSPLDLPSDDAEPDLEAVARSGDRLYWLTSHGRNSDAQPQPDRRRAFATSAAGTFSFVGKVQRNLVGAMVDHSALKPWSELLRQGANLAPEAVGGFNIEALAERAEGGLWIGFRNPLVSAAGKAGSFALLVPLLNPDKWIASDSAAPVFGDPKVLDLGGRGFRDMVRLGDGYLILAGPTAEQGSFALFAWDGRNAPAQTAATLPPDLAFEAIVVLGGREVLVIADEGDAKIEQPSGGSKKCKKAEPALRRFRAVRMTLP